MLDPKEHDPYGDDDYDRDDQDPDAHEATEDEIEDYLADREVDADL